MGLIGSKIIKKIRKSIQIDNSYTGTTKLYVFVLEMGDSRYSRQVVAYQGTENAVAGSVKDTYPADA